MILAFVLDFDVFGVGHIRICKKENLHNPYDLGPPLALPPPYFQPKYATGCYLEEAL